MSQVVVWEGTVVGKKKIADFESWMSENGFKVKYLEEFKTLSYNSEDDETEDYEEKMAGEGGRNDLLFELDSSVDIGRFSLWRLTCGMRWWEDYLDNGAYKIVPKEILKRYPYSWDNNPNKYIVD